MAIHYLHRYPSGVTSLLSSWEIEKGWFGTVSSDCDNEIDQLIIGLMVNTIPSQLVLQHHFVINQVRVALVPSFNVDDWKADEARRLVQGIDPETLRLYRDHQRYLRIGYRSYARLDGCGDHLSVIHQEVDRCIELSSRWINAMRDVATTNRSTEAVLADVSPARSVRLILTADRFQDLLDRFLDEQPNPARSMSQNYEWVHRNEAVLRQRLADQGVIIEGMR